MDTPWKDSACAAFSVIVRAALLGTLASLMGLGAGCGPTTGTIRRGDTLAITLVRGVSWDYPDEGFDPDLPGYHLAGGIGTVRISAATTPPELVLRIRTTIAHRPNLEGFTVQWADSLLQIAPFTPESPAELLVDAEVQGGQKRNQSFEQSFFEFSREEDAVRVRFLPSALRILAVGCTISWVDWYRH